jgi:hypothetical protein
LTTLAVATEALVPAPPNLASAVFEVDEASPSLQVTRTLVPPGAAQSDMAGNPIAAPEADPAWEAKRRELSARKAQVLQQARSFMEANDYSQANELLTRELPNFPNSSQLRLLMLQVERRLWVKQLQTAESDAASTPLPSNPPALSTPSPQAPPEPAHQAGPGELSRPTRSSSEPPRTSSPSPPAAPESTVLITAEEFHQPIGTGRSRPTPLESPPLAKPAPAAAPSPSEHRTAQVEADEAPPVDLSSAPARKAAFPAIAVLLLVSTVLVIGLVLVLVLVHK